MVSAPSRPLAVATGGAAPELREASPRGMAPPSPKERILQMNGPVGRRYTAMKAHRTASSESTIPRSSPKAVPQPAPPSPRSQMAPPPSPSAGRPDFRAVEARLPPPPAARCGGSAAREPPPAPPPLPLPVPSKVWSQSQQVPTPTHDRRPLERRIGVEEGAGWFSPTSASGRSRDSDDGGGAFDFDLCDRGIDRQPSVISLTRTATVPTPTPPAGGGGGATRLARLRSLRSRSPAPSPVPPGAAAPLPPEPPSPALLPDHNASASTEVLSNRQQGRARGELERGLDAASVVMQEEKASTIGSGSSRSSLSQEQLRDVATKALLLYRINSQSRTERLKEDTAHRLLQVRREQHRAVPSEATQSDLQASISPDSKESEPEQLETSTETRNDYEGEPINVLIAQQATATTSGSAFNESKGPVPKRGPRSERYAALKRKTEQRMGSKFQAPSKPSKTSEKSFLPSPSVNDSPDKFVVHPGSLNVRSTTSEADHQALSKSSVSSDSLGLGPRSARLAAIRSADSRDKPCVSSRTTWDVAPAATGQLSTDKEVNEVSVQHNTLSTTRMVPTQDQPCDKSASEAFPDTQIGSQSALNGDMESANHGDSCGNAEVTSHSKTTEAYDPWLLDTDSSNSEPRRETNIIATTATPRHISESQSQTGNYELAMPTPMHNKYASDFAFSSNVDGASTLDGRSKLQGEDFAGDASELSPLPHSTVDGSAVASLFNLRATSNQDGSSVSVLENDEQYTHLRKALGGKFNKSSRRSDRSSNKSDTSAESQSYKNPLRWWQKNYSRRTPGGTNEIVNRALEAIPSKPATEGKDYVGATYSNEDDIFEGLEADSDDRDNEDSSIVKSRSTSVSVDKLSKNTDKSSGTVTVKSVHSMSPTNVTNANANEASATGFKPTEQILSKIGKKFSSLRLGRQRDVRVYEETHNTIAEDPEGEDLEDNESSESLSLTRQESAAESRLTELRPEPSLLFNLGYALVDSLQNVCRVDITQNDSYADENMLGWRLKSPCNESGEVFDDFVKDDESTEAPHEPSNVSGSASTVSKFSGKEDPMGPQMTKKEAQNELLAIAKKAITLYGGKAKGSEKTIKAEPVGKTADQLDKKTVPSNDIAPDHISFISKLKSEGIEVLKLGRRSKWQQRILTVSEETLRSPQDSSPVDSWQCPQSLLWTKTFDGKPKSVSEIKKDGRGGLNFATLREVHCGLNSMTHPAVPRSLKNKFPALYGVMLTYTYGTERDKTVALAFKSQAEAASFTGAVEAVRSIAIGKA